MTRCPLTSMALLMPFAATSPQPRDGEVGVMVMRVEDCEPGSFPLIHAERVKSVEHLRLR